MYQPHTSFSAINTGDETASVIAKILDSDDIIIMQEIYERNPQHIGASSQNIINQIRQNGHNNAIFSSSKENTLNYIKDNAKKGDKIIIMGAHDTSLPDFSRYILNQLK